ncbi:transposase, partial [Lacihabitans sp. LS3-19]|uniref:transposase n=1 Tax=Lacihabitans sp. LS3-19 TaxID=2487335 RepID=UPI0020CC0081
MVQNTLFSFDSPIFPEWYFFNNSTELGRIYKLIPWDDLVKVLPEKRHPAGAPSYLPKAGYFGLMFLKHYTGLSDEKLMAAFQTNFSYQMFCGCRLKLNEVIRDNAFISRVRGYLAKYCDMNKIQKILVEAWKGELENTNVLMMDATCYEVHMRFPTDVKLLWESCTFLWEEQIPGLCKLSRLKIPRSKFKEQKIKQVDFSKKRKIGIKANKKRVKSLLKLLKKGIDAYQNLLDQ